MSDEVRPQGSDAPVAPVPTGPQAADQRIKTWLRDQAAVQSRLNEAIPEHQVHLGQRTAWGWLPSAIIVYWVAWILTRYVFFSSTGDAPNFHIEVFGDEGAHVTVHYDALGSAPIVYLEPNSAAKIIRMNGLRGGAPCRLVTGRLDPGTPMPKGSLTLHADTPTPYYELTPGTQDWGGWRITCQASWLDTWESFTTVSFLVSNSGITPDASDSATPAQGMVRVNGTWLQQTGKATLSSSNAALGVDINDRILKAGEDVFIQYDPAQKSAWRDYLLVLIGALLAIGATIFLEAIRPLIELAMRRYTHRET